MIRRAVLVLVLLGGCVRTVELAPVPADARVDAMLVDADVDAAPLDAPPIDAAPDAP